MLENYQQALILWRQIKPHILVISLLLLLTFSLRIINLALWPIFADEAIYIRWAQVMRAEPTLRFLPLTDGKQPLFMWLVIPFLKIFSNPLFAGRMVSVLTGTFTALGLYVFTFQITSRRQTAALASLIYAIIPYTVFFDRYALADSLLLMCGIWGLVFVTLTASKARLDTSLIAGGILGLALLTKSPAVVFMGLGALAPLLFPRKPLWYYLKFTILLLLTFGIAFAIYNILRLGPEFHQINLRNQDYRFPTTEIMAAPLQAARINAPATIGFFYLLLTPGVLLVALFGLFKLSKIQKTTALFFLIWIFGPSLIEIFIARSVTARYFLFVVPAFLILASIGLNHILTINRKNNWLRLIILIVFLGYGVYQTSLILTSPQAVRLPRIERSGYLEEWTAGYGLDQIARFIDIQSQKDTVVVGTEGFFGTTPDGLQIYFDKHQRVRVVGNSFLLDQVPQSLYEATNENLVYLVINDERLMIPDPKAHGLILIDSYPKAIRPDKSRQSLMLYQVTKPRI